MTTSVKEGFKTALTSSIEKLTDGAEAMRMTVTKAPPILLAQYVNIRVEGFIVDKATIYLKPEKYITSIDVDGKKTLRIQGSLLVTGKGIVTAENLGTVTLVKNELLWMTPKNIFMFHGDFSLAVSKDRIIELCAFVAKDELARCWDYATFPEIV